MFHIVFADSESPRGQALGVLAQAYWSKLRKHNNANGPLAIRPKGGLPFAVCCVAVLEKVPTFPSNGALLSTKGRPLYAHTI